MATVTAILCVYKRAHNFEKQIKALMDQTHKIDKYIIRVNQSEEDNQNITVPFEIVEQTKIIHSYSNLGVWARFYAAFNANTDYIYIVDDDVIPGKFWIEKCVVLAEIEEGIYGCRGSIFKSKEIRKDRIIVDEKYVFGKYKEMVDMTGRSWFFNKFILKYIVAEEPPYYPTCGEELWISYMAKKHGNIKTYIPTMSIEDPDTRGNVEPNLGVDRVANHNKEKNNYQLFYEEAIAHGFKPFKC